MDREKLMNTATRSGRHAGIIETAYVAIDRGIHQRSEEMVDLICAAFPAANRREAKAAAKFAAKVFMEERVIGRLLKERLLVRTGKFENGWAVYAWHPRINILAELNGWTLEKAFVFALRRFNQKGVCK
jgi:hypothetical protein